MKRLQVKARVQRLMARPQVGNLSSVLDLKCCASKATATSRAHAKQPLPACRRTAMFTASGILWKLVVTLPVLRRRQTLA